jgi:glutamate synthase domain-containing protein 1
MGVEPPAPGDLAVGQIFLNKASGEDRALARDVMREVLAELKLEMVAFRSVPVIESALGQRALVSRPWFGQILVRRSDAACEAGDAFERLLYLARKRIINTARSRGVQRLYISSLSSRTIVYKGLVLASELAHFYPDLSDTGLQDRHRRLPSALQHQHLSHLGARAALPHDLPQRRDQHAAGQRELDARPRS